MALAVAVAAACSRMGTSSSSEPLLVDSGAGLRDILDGVGTGGSIAGRASGGPPTRPRGEVIAAVSMCWRMVGGMTCMRYPRDTSHTFLLLWQMALQR